MRFHQGNDSRGHMSQLIGRTATIMPKRLAKPYGESITHEAFGDCDQIAMPTDCRHAFCNRITQSTNGSDARLR